MILSRQSETRKATKHHGDGQSMDAPKSAQQDALCSSLLPSVTLRGDSPVTNAEGDQ